MESVYVRPFLTPPHLPLIGSLWQKVRAAAHDLVVFYVNRLAGVQAAFNRDGTTVEMIGAEHSPGHEVTAGSLGQALSQAAGVALARRSRGESGRSWVFMSDGEFQSGQTWWTLSITWETFSSVQFLYLLIVSPVAGFTETRAIA